MRTACKPRTAPLVRASSRVASRGAGALPQGSAACSAAERRRAAVLCQSMAAPESRVLDGASPPRACAPRLPASREPACSLLDASLRSRVTRPARPRSGVRRRRLCRPVTRRDDADADGARARPRAPALRSLYRSSRWWGPLATWPRKRSSPHSSRSSTAACCPRRAPGARPRAGGPPPPPTNLSRLRLFAGLRGAWLRAQRDDARPVPRAHLRQPDLPRRPQVRYARRARPSAPPLTQLAPRDTCAPAQETFLSRCFYVSGQYGEPESYRALAREMESHEASSGHARANRIFYLSIPPSVFVSVAQNASRYASSATGARRGGGRRGSLTPPQVTRASSWRSRSAETWSPVGN